MGVLCDWCSVFTHKAANIVDPLTADKKYCNCLLIVYCCGQVHFFHSLDNVKVMFGLSCMGSLFNISVSAEKYMIKLDS